MTGTYFVLRNVLEDLLKSRGYSYYKITKEFANRGYIIPKRGEDGQIISVSTEKKFRGSNVRMFKFPIFSIEKMSNEKKEKLRKDYRAQLQGYENNEDKVQKEEEIYNYTKESIEKSEIVDEEMKELMEEAAKRQKEIKD